MKAERLFRAIGLVDEGLIEAAAETPAKKRPVWRRYAAAAACLMVLCGAGAVYYDALDAEKAPPVQADKPGEYVYYYEMQQPPTGCDFAADLSYYGKHYFLRPLRDGLPQLHGRGISYDEQRNTCAVTTRAYDKLQEQYRIRYETCLD